MVLVLNARRHRRGNQGPLGNWGKVRRRTRCDSRTLVKAGGHVKRVGCALGGSVEDLLTWISWVVKERSFRRCWWFLRPCPRFHALVLDSVLDRALLAVWSHVTTRPAQRGQRSRISKPSSSARIVASSHRSCAAWRAFLRPSLLEEKVCGKSGGFCMVRLPCVGCWPFFCCCGLSSMSACPRR